MQIKPCPFCGSQLISIELRESPWGAKTKEAHHVCNDCACSAPSYIWNLRTENKVGVTQHMENIKIIITPKRPQDDLNV